MKKLFFYTSGALCFVSFLALCIFGNVPTLGAFAATLWIANKLGEVIF